MHVNYYMVLHTVCTLQHVVTLHTRLETMPVLLRKLSYEIVAKYL